MTEKHKQEQQEAVNEATEKLRTALETPHSDTDEIAARHAEELRALEARLVAKHEEELRGAIEKVRQETSVKTSELQVTKEKSSEDNDQALKAATERGRMEAATKLKLKDSMLIKAQNNVKQLEAQIKAWREAGFIPADAPTTALAPSVPVAAKPVPSMSTTPLTSTTSPSSSTTANALPRKPSIATITPESAMRGGRGVTRGIRGVTRGAISARGAGLARGGAPAQSAAAAEPAVAGMTIMGAAGKRTREESDTPDSLAKRIKPAEGGSKPVTLRRDRIPPSNPTPTT